MSETLTYTSLVADVGDYTERDDASFTAKIPRFVMIAEQKIARDMRTLLNTKVVTGAFVAGACVLAKPERWLETISWNWDSSATALNRAQLRLRKYEYLREFWPDESATGDPVMYADYNLRNFCVAPTPATAADFELLYYEKPLPLSDTNETNIFAEEVPDLVLYAVLGEAMRFLRRPDEAAQWDSLYMQTRATITGQEVRREFDRDTLATKPPSYSPAGGGR